MTEVPEDIPSKSQGQLWEHPSAYVRHFRESVNLTISNQSELFTRREIETLRSFLDLNEATQCLFSRMMMRQGSWLRADKLSNCFPTHLLRVKHSPESSFFPLGDSDQATEAAIDADTMLITCMQELHEPPLSALLYLTPSMPWTDGWQAMDSCMAVDEIKEVYNKLTLKKAKGTRESILNDIYVHMGSSKDLFGRPLSLISTIHAVMAKVDILSATSNSSGKKNGNADSASSPKVVIVRLTEAITELFRRTQRLVQVPSMLSEYGHGRAASVRYPLPFNAAVLTIYGKIRFCDYKINVTRTLFLERGNFVQWEAAHELKWAFYEAVSISELGAALYEQHVSEIRLPASLQYRIQRVVDTFLKSAQYFNINRAPGKKECAQAAVVHILTKSKILVSANEYIYVSALSHILFAVSLCVLVIWHSYCHGRSGSQELEYNYMMSVDAGAILASLCSEVVDVFEVEARRIVKDLSAVTMATGITTGLCLNLSSNQSTIWWKDEQVMSFIPPNASGSGAILAYVLAIETLRSLLANSYLVHRRGKWVERLCIDLEHIGCRQEAWEASRDALDDPLVEGGHRITMEKKKSNLTSKLAKSAALSDIPVVPNVASDISRYESNDNDGDADFADNNVAFSKKRNRVVASKASIKRAKIISNKEANLSEIKINCTDLVPSSSKYDASVRTRGSLGLMLEALFENAATSLDGILPTNSISNTKFSNVSSRKKSMSATNDNDEIMFISSQEYYTEKISAPGSNASCNLGKSSANFNSANNYYRSKSPAPTHDMDNSGAVSNENLCAEQWPCRICTLLNDSSRSVCEVCGSTRIGITSSSASISAHKGTRSAASSIEKKVLVSRLSGFFSKIDSMSSSPVPSPVVVESRGFLIIEEDRKEVVQHHSPDPNLPIDFRSDVGHRSLMGVVLTSAPPSLVALWGDIISPPPGWRPDILELTGRRLGSKRKGKSLLLGLNGDAMSVEDMVLQMLGDPQRDVDEALLHFDLINNTTLSFSGLDYTEGLNMYTGGRWSGWHCEGTPLKSLFSLIMWEVLFLDKVENVFYTPYQDQPLDLQYGAVFYMHRKAEIDSRFKWLENAHMSEILADLSRIYRKYYKCRCISMSWVHPLHILQAIALGMKSSGLIALCKLIISNFRHFQGGAPDLLVIRAYRIVPDVSGGCGVIEYVDMDSWLGVEWKRLGRPAQAPRGLSARRRGGKPSEEDWNSLKDTVLTDKDKLMGNSSVVENPDGENGTFHEIAKETEKACSINKRELIMKDEDLMGVAPAEVEEGPRVQRQFIYNGPDLKDPCASSPFHSENNLCCDFKALSWVSNWTFECMFVEVKGPTDHLADRQSVWLHALHRLCREGTGTRAVVCQIREGRNGQQVGHHESADFAAERCSTCVDDGSSAEEEDL